MKNLVIINYGMGNLYSVYKALKYLKIPVKISDKREDIKNACGLIFPGVGAFGDAIKEIRKRKIFDIIKKEVLEGKPILGVCLGFQLLFSKSYEFGVHKGLDIIKGKVIKFKRERKIPHMGWNTIKIVKKDNRLFKGIKDQEYFYFVHSYYVVPEDNNIILSKTKYENTEFVSAIENKNIFGMQFHPEKSGEKGLLIYKNFYEITLNQN